ncbi:MAG: hypothetical protein KBD25_06120 [Rickettsiaceae bacterium]|nr:hypothetical protein [Rickettsiaceae bacterium]
MDAGKCPHTLRYAIIFRYKRYLKLRTASIENDWFQVTHPFHPLFEKKFKVNICHFSWGDDRVFFYDDHDKFRSLPLKWTSLAQDDPLALLVNCNSCFRAPDLLELARLIKDIIAMSDIIN